MFLQSAIVTLSPDEVPNDYQDLLSDVSAKFSATSESNSQDLLCEVSSPKTLRIFDLSDSSKYGALSRMIADLETFLNANTQSSEIKRDEARCMDISSGDATTVLPNDASSVLAILTIYFPIGYSKVDQDRFESDYNKLMDVVKREAEGYTAWAGGWVMEDLLVPGNLMGANKSVEATQAPNGKGYVALMAFESVEAHMSFSKTSAHGENIHLLVGAKDLLGFHLVHCRAL